MSMVEVDFSVNVDYKNDIKIRSSDNVDFFLTDQNGNTLNVVNKDDAFYVKNKSSDFDGHVLVKVTNQEMLGCLEYFKRINVVDDYEDDDYHEDDEFF